MIRCKIPLALLLGVLWLLPGTAPAAGQSEGAAAASREKARRHFFKGLELYKKKQYQRALDSFLQAHVLDRRPEMLFNIGLCHQKLGHTRQAIDSYKGYIINVPDARNRKQVEGRIQKLTRELEARRRGAPGGGGDEPGEAPGKQPRPDAPPALTPAPPQVSSPPPADRGAAPDRQGWLYGDFKRTGLQLSLELGGGGGTKDVLVPWGNTGNFLVLESGGGFALGVGVQHRPIPYLSYGAQVTWIKQGVGAGGFDASGNLLDARLGVEVYPLSFTRFDPWVGIGAGFGLYTASVDLVSYQFDLQLYGVSLNVGVGLRIYVTRWLALGPVFRFSHVFWLQTCDSTSARARSCIAVGDLTTTVKGSLPAMLSGGLETSFHF